MILIKILIIAGKLQIGGFSKSLIYLLNCLQKYDVKVDLFLTGESNSSLIHQIPRTVNIIENELTFEIRQNEEVFIKKVFSIILSGRWYYKLKYRLIKQIKYRNSNVPQNLAMKYYQIDEKLKAKHLKNECNFQEEYDCIVSWEELFCNYLLALKVKAKKKIGYIHPDYIGAKFYIPVDLPILSKLDNIFVIAESCKKSLCIAIPKLANKVITIPNVISASQITELSNESINDMIADDVFTIVTVCRLQNVSKALERAVAISSKLRDDGLIFRWYIVGDGEDKEKLLQLINQAGLDDVFILLGGRDNPYPYIKNANIFVLQSYYEGRPIVIDEAMIIGTPVLITNYSSASEQVVNGTYGYIVNNEEQDIYIKLKEVLENPEQLDVMRKNLAHKDWNYLEDCSAFINGIKG